MVGSVADVQVQAPIVCTQVLFPVVFSEYLLLVRCPHNEPLRMWAASVQQSWLQGTGAQPWRLMMGAGPLEREQHGASTSPGTLVQSYMAG